MPLKFQPTKGRLVAISILLTGMKKESLLAQPGSFIHELYGRPLDDCKFMSVEKKKWLAEQRDRPVVCDFVGLRSSKDPQGCLFFRPIWQARNLLRASSFTACHRRPWQSLSVLRGTTTSVWNNNSAGDSIRTENLWNFVHLTVASYFLIASLIISFFVALFNYLETTRHWTDFFDEGNWSMSDMGRNCWG